MVFYSVKILQ